LVLDRGSEAAVARDVGDDLECVGHRVTGGDQFVHVGGANEVPVPGADAEAAQRLEPLVGQLAGDRQSEEVPAEAGETAVRVHRTRAIHPCNLDHSPVEVGEGAALFQSDGVHGAIRLSR
jgi:hypothetical protein